MEKSVENKNLPEILKLIELAYTERRIQFETGKKHLDGGAEEPFLQMSIVGNNPSPEFEALIAKYTDA